jgi:hypothetical protein
MVTELQTIVFRFPEIELLKERELLADLKAIKTILDGVRKIGEALQKAKEISTRNLEEQQQLCSRMGTFIPLELEPGPGETNPNGPRHNNDLADYRGIKVLPTQEEIMCELPPYLPKKGNPLRFVPSPVDLYLDSQFRLLREDMMASVRRGVQRFFYEKALTKLKPGTYRYNTIPEIGRAGSSSSDTVSLTIFREMEIEGLRPLIYKGLCFEVSFSQPELVSKMKLKERQAFWEQHAGSRILGVGSLVGLVLGMNDGKSPGDRATSDQLFFATVMDRDKHGGNLFKNSNRCTVILSLLDNKATIELAGWLASPQQRRSRSKEHVMLQVRGHFFAGYEPVLTTMKTQHVTTIPFLRTLVGAEMGDAFEENTGFLPPSSLVNKELDLSVLLKKEVANKNLRVAIRDFEQVKRELRRREHDLILDKTQIDAFALSN